MLHGRVVRPPAIGAKLESVDEGSIKDIAGIVKVVREGNFLGVVAQSEWAAIKAAQTIKATWSKSETLPEQAKLYEHVRATKVGQGRRHRATSATPPKRWPRTASGSSTRPPTISPSTPTARSGRRARSPNSRTAS